MPKFKVYVENEVSYGGIVVVEAEDEFEAADLVETFRADQIDWDELSYREVLERMTQYVSVYDVVELSADED